MRAEIPLATYTYKATETGKSSGKMGQWVQKTVYYLFPNTS